MRRDRSQRKRLWLTICGLFVLFVLTASAVAFADAPAALDHFSGGQSPR